MLKKLGQVAPEAVMIAGVMVFLLLAMYVVSVHLTEQWGVEKQRMQATAAANSLAQAVNSVAAAGNGSSMPYFNAAGPDVANMTIYQLRSLRAYYREGGFVSVGLVTNRTSISSSGIPLNVDLWLNNTNGIVYIAGA